MDIKELDAARDAALRCLSSAAELVLWGSINRCRVRLSGYAIDSLQASGAEVFGKLAESHTAARSFFTSATREDLLLATAGMERPRPEYTGDRRAPLWHDVAIMIAGGAFLMLVDHNTAVCAANINQHGFPPYEVGCGARLEKYLAELAGDGVGEFWLAVADRAATFDLGNYEGIKAGIEAEWASAKASIAAKHGSQQGQVKGNETSLPVVASSLSARDLAEKYGVNLAALNKRLERWRCNHDTGYVEVSNHAANEPRYLYDESAIGMIVDDLKAKAVGRKRPTNVQQK